MPETTGLVFCIKVSTNSVLILKDSCMNTVGCRLFVFFAHETRAFCFKNSLPFSKYYIITYVSHWSIFRLMSTRVWMINCYFLDWLRIFCWFLRESEKFNDIFWTKFNCRECSNFAPERFSTWQLGTLVFSLNVLILPKKLYFLALNCQKMVIHQFSEVYFWRFNSHSYPVESSSSISAFW